jgi:hypothetical protein
MNFRGLSTPLRLRLTLRRLFKISKHPYLDFLRLLWPIPWYFSCPLPLPSPQELNNDDELFFRRQDGIQIQRTIPLWRLRDTPQRSLYRLYEAFCANAEGAISEETEYFWHHGEPRWATRNIQDPKDSNPVRYAMLASLTETLVNSFNWRLGLGLRRDGPTVEMDDDDDGPAEFQPEEVPLWTKKVPALSETLVLHADGNAPEFQRRNIIASSGELRTV